MDIVETRVRFVPGKITLGQGTEEYYYIIDLPGFGASPVYPAMLENTEGG